MNRSEIAQFLPPYGRFGYLARARRNMLELWWPAAFKLSLMYNRLLWLHQFVVNKPEYIEHILLTNQQNYRKSHFVERLLGPVLGQGLVIAEGEVWRRQRRTEAPAFQHGHIQSFAPIMTECAARLVARLESKIGRQVDMAAEMRAVTLDVIVRSLFSADATDESEAMREAIDGLSPYMRPQLADLFGLPRWMRGGRREQAEAVARVDRVIERILASRANQSCERRDLYSLLVEARDPETGQGMSVRQLRDEVVTLFLAGHDTTAMGLSFTWHLLGQHPEVEAKLHAELDRDRGDLAYTRMVFQEAIRLYPPAHMLSRTAIAEDRLGNTRIPKGSIITLSPYVTQRNPTLWPDPERFDPERFTPEASAGRHRFAYFPFGGGPRICIGMSFAMQEAEIIIAGVARRFRLVPVPDRPVKPMALVTLRPETGVWMTVERRQAS